MTQMRSREYWEKHKMRERERWRRKAETITKICKVCQKSFSQRERPGTTKTCSTVCQQKNKKQNDKRRDGEKKKLYGQKYQKTNKVALAEYQKKYRKEKKDIVSKWEKKRSQNPKRKMYVAMRDSWRRSQKTINLIGNQDLLRIYKELGQSCVVCKTTKDITIDHIVPISKGGTNNQENLQILCRSCNSKKRDKTMKDFLIDVQDVINKYL
ncbi:MAG: HNH endonuclease [Candidatus Fonsibacter lacus]|nr:HNH endonuclease [Pseudomonadota bacterium]NCU72330.1 HNH endonuclease [Candidatus Fonsibacter lacus]